jgi:polysaccharide chain length determinant protein (PEP-CTERM system associated)
MHELAQQLLTYVKAAWRYRWYAVVVAWIIAVGGWVFVAQIPNRYEASARVYVDTQSVLRPLLAGLAVQPDVSQMVMMMSRTLISRPNVDRVIRMSDMDIRVKNPEDREQMITRISKELTIKSAGSENLYTISFRDDDPQLAKRVVQSLLTIFVEGSLGNKRKDTDSARNFINEQLKAYNEKLVAAENAVTEFKQRHMGLLSAEGRSYYTRLQEAQAAVSQANLELREATNSRDAIKQQLAGSVPMLLDEQGAPEIVGSHELDTRIEDLQKKLDNLRLSYTEQHPDIITINRMLKQLKDEKEKDLREKKAKLKKRGATSTASQNPIYQQLSVALAEAEANVASMKARVAEYEKRYAALNAAATAIPQYEAEFTQLTRDYEVTKKNYENLLARRESAQISGDMEVSTSGVDFRIIDPPQVPPVPSAPNRPLMMSLVLLAALGAGSGIAFLLSQIRPTFADERRLREISGLPVFGTVVMAWTDEQLAKRRKGLVVFGVSLLSLLSAYGAIMALLTFGARA